MTGQEFIQHVRDAIARNNTEELRTAICEFSSFCFKSTSETRNLDDETYDSLLDIIQTCGFLAFDDSDILLMTFEQDWGILNDLQRIQLSESLAKILPLIKSRQSKFIICDIFGKYFQDRRGLQTLIQSLPLGDDYTRANIAYGIGCIERFSEQPDLCADARRTLEEMAATDKSEMVQREAKEILLRTAPEKN